MHRLNAKKSPYRVIVVFFILLAVTLLAVLLHRVEPYASWLPGCLFHRVTNLHCPGCGMTRATLSILHGRWEDAIRFNTVGIILLPATLALISLESIARYLDKPIPMIFRINGRSGWAIVWILLIFGIMRNIPCWPFLLLAPTQECAARPSSKANNDSTDK